MQHGYDILIGDGLIIVEPYPRPIAGGSGVEEEPEVVSSDDEYDDDDDYEPDPLELYTPGDYSDLPAGVVERLRAHAAAGAAFLDIVRSNWSDDVDPDRLNLASSNACILGQTDSEYGTGVKNLSLSNEHAEALGFVIIDGLMRFADDKVGGLFYHLRDKMYDALTDAWKSELSGR